MSTGTVLLWYRCTYSSLACLGDSEGTRSGAGRRDLVLVLVSVTLEKSSDTAAILVMDNLFSAAFAVLTFPSFACIV